jgi:glutamine synthetase
MVTIMDEPTIEEWMDRHHVEIVRTHATNLEGHGVGKYLNRPKFLKSLPEGHTIADIALAMDAAGNPHLSLWHEFRHGQFGDIQMKPDISTIVTDGTDPDLGHIICDFVGVNGEEIPLCPRTILRKVTQQIADRGFTVKAAFELEFFLFRDSFDTARRRGYRNLDPITASSRQNIYLLRNAHHVKPFMDEVIKRLNWQKFPWESWSDEGGTGQVELNFSPTDPLSAADTIARARQLIYEVAVDQGLSVTFMAAMKVGYGSGLHIHHSLQHLDGSAAFLANGDRSPLLLNWIAGITETMMGATSILCPTINAYRRLVEFTSPPLTPSWAEENKTAGLRVISRSDSLARIEHRLPSSDANPYLALAVILAGGLAGLDNQLSPPEELTVLGWGLPDDVKKLPTTILSAARALEQDQLLPAILGKDVIDYWVDTRKLEWMTFHDECDEADATSATDWEYNRYFELI